MEPHLSQRKDYDGCPATTRPLSSTPSSQVSRMCIQLKDKKAWLAPPGVLLGKRKARDQPEHEVTAWLSLLQRQAYTSETSGFHPQQDVFSALPSRSTFPAWGRPRAPPGNQAPLALVALETGRAQLNAMRFRQRGGTLMKQGWWLP